MSSRDQILAAVAKNQPQKTALPDIGGFETQITGSLEKFTEVLTAIGGQVKPVSNYQEIEAIIAGQYSKESKIVTPVTELKNLFAADSLNVSSAHDFHDVALAIIKGSFGVAENGAVWVNEEQMGHRALPFICENLAIIIKPDKIVPTMHTAYPIINNTVYGYGAFIAGPSKTADIEQSLVIGAHGPRSLTVFLLSE